MLSYSQAVQSALTQPPSDDQLLFQQKMVYADRVALALAQKLADRAQDLVDRDSRLKHPRSGGILTFHDRPAGFPASFANPSRFEDSNPFNMVYADALGNVFPQEQRPVDGFPALEGDLRRIPISQVVLGFRSKDKSRKSRVADSHSNLKSRGVTSVLIRLHQLLNQSAPTAVYLNSTGHGSFTIEIAWLPQAYELNQVNLFHHKFNRVWSPALTLPATC